MGYCYQEKNQAGKRKQKIDTPNNNKIETNKNEELSVKEEKPHIELKENIDKKTDNENIANNEDEKNLINENIKIRENKDELKKSYDEIQKEINNIINERQVYYNEIQLYMSEINIDKEKTQLNNNNIKSEKINNNIKNRENLIEKIKNEKNKISEYLDKIKNLNKDELKTSCNILDNNFSELEKLIKNNASTNSNLNKNIEDISNELNNLKQIHKKLLEINYSEIKTQINSSKNIINEDLNNLKLYKEAFDKLINEINKETRLDDKFLNNSLLLYYQQTENNEKNLEQEPEGLYTKGWDEKCYIHNEYDLYEINFEFKCKITNGSKRATQILKSIPLTQDKIIEMEFKIDDVLINNYKIENNKLIFDEIKFKNNDTKKFYLKYKQEEKEYERKFYRKNNYGLSSISKGRYAIFHLILKDDWEVINFDEQIFTKVSNNEYQLKGIVPEEGKYTNVLLSRKSTKIHLSYIKRIESLDKKPLKRTKSILNYNFEKGGNKNNQIKLETTTDQNNYEKKDVEKGQRYSIEFNNVNKNFVEVKIEGDLINHCSGEWTCDLTDEQIEEEIPKDYINQKEQLKEIANNIIKEYNEQHKNDVVQISDVAKIGKWVSKNIKYDFNGKNLSSPLEIINKKLGICKQYTILFNALLYSLGYKCIYVSGFVIQDKISFNNNDAHAWSLVKINGKWLPFDATSDWGIFTGKLPVGHIFQNYFCKGESIEKTLNSKVYISGNFVS